VWCASTVIESQKVEGSITSVQEGETDTNDIIATKQGYSAMKNKRC
jgi:hypothetical protein